MKKAFNLNLFAKYIISFVGYFLLGFLDGKYSPFAISLLVANLYVGLKPLPSLILYSLSFLPSLSPTPILVGFFAGLIVCLTFLVYRRLKKLPKLEISLFLALALSPYLAIPSFHPLPLKLIICASIILSSFIMTSGAKVWLVKGLKYKLGLEDFCSACFLYLTVAFGAIIAFGEGFHFAIGVFIMLMTSLFIKGYSPVLVGAIISLPTCLHSYSFLPIATFIIYSLAISLTSQYSKLFTVIGCALTTTCLYFFTDSFASMQTYAPFLSLLGCVAYLFFPDVVTRNWTEKLKTYREDVACKYSINMHRSYLSDKLFELSYAFNSMKQSIEGLKDTYTNNTDWAKVLSNEVLTSVCEHCNNYRKCKKQGYPLEDELEKILELGIAKNGLNLIDLPKSFSKICPCQDELVTFADELIKKYASFSEEKRALSQSKELILRQTEGVATALEELATNLCLNLTSDNEKENLIRQNLLRCGIIVKEIAYLKGEDDEELIIALPFDNLKNPLLLKAISEITGYKSIISTNLRISQELCAITIKKSPTFDATFGIANKVKFDKQKSGDTHSAIKLAEGKFLIALSDGMGSGDKAEETSSVAISLIESFYRAGLSSKTILPIVNKLLAFGEEDNFTALDVGVVDLFSLTVDFIKIGSPYSFIISKDCVKVIEGNSLPLGILEEISPTVCKTNLQVDDVIVLVSDGITDAFETSSDLINFLSTQKALNPKTLADNVLERALYLNEGVAKDDMTVFCIRIFAKND